MGKKRGWRAHARREADDGMKANASTPRSDDGKAERHLAAGFISGRFDRGGARKAKFITTAKVVTGGQKPSPEHRRGG